MTLVRRRNLDGCSHRCRDSLRIVLWILATKEHFYAKKACRTAACIGLGCCLLVVRCVAAGCSRPESDQAQGADRAVETAAYAARQARARRLAHRSQRKRPNLCRVSA